MSPKLYPVSTPLQPLFQNPLLQQNSPRIPVEIREIRGYFLISIISAGSFSAGRQKLQISDWFLEISDNFW